MIEYEIVIFNSNMEENLSRRQFLSILGGVAGSAVLAGCGPSPVGASGSNESAPQSNEVATPTTQQFGCKKAESGDSVTGIAQQLSGDPNALVGVDTSSNGSIDYVSDANKAGIIHASPERTSTVCVYARE
jgi:hypothetical protein